MCANDSQGTGTAPRIWPARWPALSQPRSLASLIMSLSWSSGEMKRKLKVLVTPLVLVAITTGVVAAHDLFIKMDAYHLPAGTPVEVPIINGDTLARLLSAEPPDLLETSRLVLCRRGPCQETEREYEQSTAGAPD